MPIDSNLNTTPYWDDYNEDKDFYKILFKPGVSVQTRELNQLQSILQKQIERFGDHVFKSGTIVSGCNFDYNPYVDYIKIADLQEDGQPVNPSGYKNLYLKNSSNLQAIVVNFALGFESKNPDLNTLYVSYINSGNSYNISTFSNDDVLEVISKTNTLYDVDVINGGLGFANSDDIHVVSAINVLVSSGTFSNGEVITQATSGAKQQIVGIDPGANSTLKILKVRPLLSEQLSNTSANSSSWTLYTGYNITGNTSSAVANVVSGIGSGAYGSIITDSLGVVQNIVLTYGGEDYTTLPQVIIKPSSATASVSTLDLSARTYKAKIRVANGSFTAPTGYGYNFSVTEGIIYQKGIFSRVLPQSILVSKYNSSPNNIFVGFTSDESIVKYTTDSSLLDNAANTFNEAAPGADRLKIQPKLIVANSNLVGSNVEFLPLVEFIEGRPARENRETIYNELAKEFEKRTRDTAGDFVINSFRSITKEKVSNNTHFTIQVDPGLGYISGKRVNFVNPVLRDVPKANTVFTKPNQTITANYGNYIKVRQLVGFFNFKSGDSVSLYDTAQSYTTNVTVGSSATLSPSGSAIGTAKMRSLVYEQGIMGTPEAVYRLYLFDIDMNSGKSFRSVRSAYYNGSNFDGLCDLVLELDATTNTSIPFIYDTENPDIIFKTSALAVKSITDINYTYRTSTENLVLNSNGSISITAPASKVFPYSGSLSLSSTQKQDFYIAPISNTYSSNAAGTVSGGTTSPNLTGTSTSFSTVYKSGDHLAIYNGPSTYDVRRIVNVVNNTVLILNANLSFTNTSSNTALFFPAYYPINISERSDRTITTSANSSVVTVDIANSSLATSANVVAFYNIKIPSATQVNKDINRDLYVKIYTGNNNTLSSSGNNNTGPWSLGIPDVFRLKNVYYGNTTSNTDITKYFYINSYNDGDIVKNAELRIIPGSNIAISNTQWLLVKFDAFDNNGDEGFITINSYNDIINDNSGFSNNTYINRLEVPEFTTSDGRYYDTIDCFDFRPLVTNTATYATSVASADVNPSNTQTLNSDEKYFPVPDSEIFFDLDFYGFRKDVAAIHKDNTVSVVNGNPDPINPREPELPEGALHINTMLVPAYPTLPQAVSNTTLNILNNRIGNDVRIVNSRKVNYTITNVNNAKNQRAQPVRYSMSQIAKLERRISEIEENLSLSLLEKEVVNLTIPSSNDPTKNRFKNAFLSENFSTHTSAEINHVEFSCYIDDVSNLLLPLNYVIPVEGIFDYSDAATSNNVSLNSFLTLPYTETTLISQLVASQPIVAKADPPPPDTTTTQTYVSETVLVPFVELPAANNNPAPIYTQPPPEEEVVPEELGFQLSINFTNLNGTVECTLNSGETFYYEIPYTAKTGSSFFAGIDKSLYFLGTDERNYSSDKQYPYHASLTESGEFITAQANFKLKPGQPLNIPGLGTDILKSSLGGVRYTTTSNEHERRNWNIADNFIRPGGQTYVEGSYGWDPYGWKGQFYGRVIYNGTGLERSQKQLDAASGKIPETMTFFRD